MIEHLTLIITINKLNVRSMFVCLFVDSVLVITGPPEK